MNTLKKIASILRYLFQAEDTSAESSWNHSSTDNNLETKYFWLGPVKAVMWLVIAIAWPILLVCFLKAFS
jgi:hypothetical protein